MDRCYLCASYRYTVNDERNVKQRLGAFIAAAPMPKRLSSGSPVPASDLRNRRPSASWLPGNSYIASLCMPCCHYTSKPMKTRPHLYYTSRVPRYLHRRQDGSSELLPILHRGRARMTALVSRRIRSIRRPPHCTARITPSPSSSAKQSSPRTRRGLRRPHPAERKRGRCPTRVVRPGRVQIVQSRLAHVDRILSWTDTPVSDRLENVVERRCD